MLDYIAEGASPVKGVKSFKKLSKKYADLEKMGDRLPNLDLEGDMLQSLTFKIVRGGLEVGIFDKEEAIKSFGHNTGFEGHPYLDGVGPKRQFIPDEDQSLKSDIEKGVLEIIDEFKDG
jgi:hypothetical protein